MKIVLTQLNFIKLILFYQINILSILTKILTQNKLQIPNFLS